MELAPRYCRTCGSRILVKHICHNCNNEPLKGDNYCYDCGALTPNADNCLKCGAKYKQNFPIAPVIIGALLIVAMTVAGYFLLQPKSKSLSISQEKPIEQTTPVTPSPVIQELPLSANKVINNTVDTLASNTGLQIDSTITKPPPADSAKKIITGSFSASEVRAFSSKCSYAENNRVIFFISGGTGYIKMNEKKHVLKRIRKGVDVAVFAGSEYSATLTINGLSGNANQWLASCTLVVKNNAQNKSVRHKVYSSCIEL
jgi:hypothetical protein